jgi:hypothetical protein
MTSTEQLTIRPAHHGDEAVLDRLAQLDSARLSDGPHVIAERDGIAVAAISEADGSVVADPFEPTADVVAVLQAYQERVTAARSAAIERHRVFGVRVPRFS